MIQKQLLTNVVIIRLILIILLVFYHAFAIFSGAWTPIDGFPEIEIYWWMDKLSYAFLLEMFVFISGYVFGYQVKTKGQVKLQAKNLFYSKFKRLIIPSMVFSLLYILLLKNIKQPFDKTLYEILNGVAHMWFLPMLFWCFAGVWLIERIKMRTQIVVPVLLIVSICSFILFPFQLNKAMYYMLFFYLGYYIQRKEYDFKRYYTVRNTILLFISFTFLFTIITIFCSNLELLLLNYLDSNITKNILIIKVLKYLIANLLKLLYSSVGLAALFVLIGCIEKRIEHKLPQWVVSLGGLSMGVYIFQQFILKFLYDYTSLPSLCGPILLPWSGFIIALICSLFLSFLSLKTKVGRSLVG